MKAMNIPTCLSTQNWWIRPWWCRIKFSFWFQIQYFFPPYLSCKSCCLQVLRGWPSSCGSGGINYLRHRPSQEFCVHLPICKQGLVWEHCASGMGDGGKTQPLKTWSLDLTVNALHSFTLFSVLEWEAGLENTLFLSVIYLFSSAASLLLGLAFL